MNVVRITTLSMRDRRFFISSRVTRLECPRRIRFSIGSAMCCSGTSMYFTTFGVLAIASMSSSSNALGNV